jgi:uncharacterized protein involved in exopolysaccharide biosynthesis
MALGLCLNLFMPPVYRASVRLEIHRPVDRSPLTGQSMASPGYQSENLSMLTAAQQITNRALLGRVAGDFGALGWIRTVPSAVSGESDIVALIRWLRVPTASASWRSSPSAARTDLAESDPVNGQVNWLRTVIKVEPIQDTRLVDLKVEHNSPEAAVAIADRLAQLFVSDQWKRSTEADTSRLVYLRNQLEQMRSGFESSAEQAGGTDVSRLATVQARIRQLNDAITQLNAEYLKACDDQVATKAKLDRLAAAGASGLDDSRQLVTGNPGLEALQRDLQNCRVQLVSARAVYQEKHPKLIALESQYEALQASFRQEQERAIASLRGEADVIRQRAASLKAELGRSRGELAALEGESQRYAAGQSAVKSDQDLYGLLLAKVQEGRMEGLMKSPPVEIVDAATLAPHPVRPRKLLNLAVCLVTGLFFGSGLALVRDSMSRTIRTPRDVEEQLELPLLGVIPKEV